MTSDHLGSYNYQILLANSPEQNYCGKIYSHHGDKLDENRTSTLTNSSIIQSIGYVCRLIVISPTVSYHLRETASDWRERPTQPRYNQIGRAGRGPSHKRVVDFLLPGPSLGSPMVTSTGRRTDHVIPSDRDGHPGRRPRLCLRRHRACPAGPCHTAGGGAAGATGRPGHRQAG